MIGYEYGAYTSRTVDLHALVGRGRGGPTRPVPLVANTPSRAAFARLLVAAGVFENERAASRDVSRYGHEKREHPVEPGRLYAVVGDGSYREVPLREVPVSVPSRTAAPASATRAPVTTEEDVVARAREAGERTPGAPADALLPLAVALTTPGEGRSPLLDVVVRVGSVRLAWRRVYPDGVESDERMTDAPTLSGALAHLVEYERAADELGEHEAAAS